MISDEKYILHIPLSKFENDELKLLEIDDLISDLLFKLGDCYMSNVKSHYKSRIYDELLITVFSNDDILGIFEEWFLKNNHILCQEAFAYEHKSQLIIKSIK